MAIEPARPIDGLFSDLMTVVEVPVTDEDDGVDSPSGLQVIYGRSPLYSFGPDEYGYLYLGSTARLVISDDQRTLLMWIEKALRTPRGQYSIYGPDYGTNIAAGIGGNGSLPELLLDGPADLKRCLLLHPLIEEIRDVRFLRAGGDGDSIQIHLTIVEKLAGLTPLVFLIGEGSTGIPGFTPPTPDPSPMPLTPVALDGAIADGSSLSAALLSGPSLAGTIADQSSLVATDLSISEESTGLIANVSSLSGGLTLISGLGTPLDPEIDDLSTIDGVLNASWALSGSIAGSSSLTVDSVGDRPLDGTIVDASSLSAELSVGQVLSGTIVDLGTFDAPLIVQRSLSGVFSDVSALAVDLPISRGFAGEADDSSSLSAALSVLSPSFAVSGTHSSSGVFLGATPGSPGSFSVVTPNNSDVRFVAITTQSSSNAWGLSPSVGATTSFSTSWVNVAAVPPGAGTRWTTLWLYSFPAGGAGMTFTMSPSTFTNIAWNYWSFTVTNALATLDATGGSACSPTSQAGGTFTATGGCGGTTSPKDLYIALRSGTTTTAAPYSALTGNGSQFDFAGATNLPDSFGTPGTIQFPNHFGLEVWIDLGGTKTTEIPSLGATNSDSAGQDLIQMFAFQSSL